MVSKLKAETITRRKVSAGLVERGVLFLAVSLFFTSWPGFTNESRVVSANLASTFEVSAQWRCPSAPGAGYDTVEIFLENTGSRPITFKNVTWNGANLAFQTGRFYLDPQSSTISPKVTWWQFYPSGQVMPNEAVVLRVNFQRAPGTEQRLMLTVM